MEEWKELEKDSLPPDILTGGYEFSDYDTPTHQHIPTSLVVLDILNNILLCRFRYYYRKPEPKQPSHSEIWNKCWKNGDMWVRVISYENGVYWIFDKSSDDDTNEFTSVSKDWFIGVESADIPPYKETPCDNSK